MTGSHNVDVTVIIGMCGPQASGAERDHRESWLPGHHPLVVIFWP